MNHTPHPETGLKVSPVPEGDTHGRVHFMLSRVSHSIVLRKISWLFVCAIACGGCLSPKPSELTLPVLLIDKYSWPEGVSLESLKDLPVPELEPEGIVMIAGTNKVTMESYFWPKGWPMESPNDPPLPEWDPEGRFIIAGTNKVTMESYSWPEGGAMESTKDPPLPELEEEGRSMIADTNTVTVHTWREFDHWEDLDFEPLCNAELSRAAWFCRRRGFIPFMEKAQPAMTSFVRELPLNAKLPSMIVPEFAPAIMQEEVDLLLKAELEGKSWQQAYPDTRMLPKPAHLEPDELPHARYQSEHGRLTVMPLAYGDYNHDGFDDVLIFVFINMDPGSLSYGYNTILTRKSATGRFTILPF